MTRPTSSSSGIAPYVRESIDSKRLSPNTNTARWNGNGAEVRRVDPSRSTWGSSAQPVDQELAILQAPRSTAQRHDRLTTSWSSRGRGRRRGRPTGRSGPSQGDLVDDDLVPGLERGAHAHRGHPQGCGAPSGAVRPAGPRLRPPDAPRRGASAVARSPSRAGASISPRAPLSRGGNRPRPSRVDGDPPPSAGGGRSRGDTRSPAPRRWRRDRRGRRALDLVGPDVGGDVLGGSDRESRGATGHPDQDDTEVHNNPPSARRAASAVAGSTGGEGHLEEPGDDEKERPTSARGAPP